MKTAQFFEYKRLDSGTISKMMLKKKNSQTNKTTFFFFK